MSTPLNDPVKTQIISELLRLDNEDFLASTTGIRKATEIYYDQLQKANTTEDIETTLSSYKKTRNSLFKQSLKNRLEIYKQILQIQE
jgi:hypothetical protein